jgi:hypothetical protein
MSQLDFLRAQLQAQTIPIMQDSPSITGAASGLGMGNGVSLASSVSPLPDQQLQQASIANGSPAVQPPQKVEQYYEQLERLRAMSLGQSLPLHQNAPTGPSSPSLNDNDPMTMLLPPEEHLVIPQSLATPQQVQHLKYLAQWKLLDAKQQQLLIQQQQKQDGSNNSNSAVLVSPASSTSNVPVLVAGNPFALPDNNVNNVNNVNNNSSPLSPELLQLQLQLQQRQLEAEREKERERLEQEKRRQEAELARVAAEKELQRLARLEEQLQAQLFEQQQQQALRQQLASLQQQQQQLQTPTTISPTQAFPEQRQQTPSSSIPTASLDSSIPSSPVLVTPLSSAVNSVTPTAVIENAASKEISEGIKNNNSEINGSNNSNNSRGNNQDSTAKKNPTTSNGSNASNADNATSSNSNTSVTSINNSKTVLNNNNSAKNSPIPLAKLQNESASNSVPVSATDASTLQKSSMSRLAGMSKNRPQAPQKVSQASISNNNNNNNNNNTGNNSNSDSFNVMNNSSSALVSADKKEANSKAWPTPKELLSFFVQYDSFRMEKFARLNSILTR